MGMLSRFSRQKMREEDFGPQTNDVLIVFDDEQKTSDIKRINLIQEDKVMVIDEYVIPIEDCVVTNSAMGRNFFYRAPTQSIMETKRLAQLEKSIVLSKITNFKPKPPESPVDFTKIGLMIIIVISFIVFGAVSCSNGKAQHQEVPTQSYQKSDK
ncbi:TPA: hypothetical protein QCY76_005890 [Bacillus cereus]|nr:hypothetical protein [Bacillus cereus]HDR8089633.1 hypothetical protein [Bacillus cereus]HDX9524574.1 hypothetical protein [Bacillus cereus]HDX9586674.1 hypothetical protein [Bacillus cereus]HDX9608642.1 hypothetical protein [Bacillus cereus]